MAGDAQVAAQSSARERAGVIGALAALAALAWGYMLYMQWGMRHMELGADMAIMPAMTDWRLPDLGLVCAMWAVMMGAMMLPSAAPMALAYLRIRRSRGAGARPYLGASLLIGGYVAVWLAFSAAATLLQWGLLEASLITPMMDSASTVLSAALLVGAGIFQFTPLKRACLTGCRSPVEFLLKAWQEGATGAFMLGVKNGAACLGCCWALMLLPLVLGVMNLLWMAVLTLFLVIEKILPGGDWFGRAVGFGLILWGGALLLQ
jgi:predicted metal-binding membrane protein